MYHYLMLFYPMVMLQIVAKRRSDNAEVKFSVGLIMKHKR